MGKLYTEDSIESLSPLQFTRLRPQVYCGDTAYATQLLVEIFSNAVDEFRNGFGSQIDIIIKGSAIHVRDYGQGFLVNSVRDDGKTVLEAAFSVLNTSGKYREDGTYEGTSLGSFGIGAKLACFLSHDMTVETFRDGMSEQVCFHEGVFTGRKVREAKETENGTSVAWLASEEFFDHPEVNIGEIKTLFKTISALCPGLTINLDDNGAKSTYSSKNGINDLVDEAVKNKELIDNRFEMKFENGKNKIDMVMTYTSNYSLTVVPYVNTGLTIAGPHITQIKALLTREFNKFFREKKWLKDKDENLTGDDIQEGLYIVFNITAPSVGYDAQVKSRITKLDMTPFTPAIIENLRYWFSANEKEIKVIADKALNARKAREAAQKAKEAVRNKVPKTKKEKLLDMPTKLVDCWSKDRSKCELFVVEGDSAAGPLVSGRDAEFTAIFPVRGKIISAYKNSSEKIFANQEVNNLIKAIGLSLDVKTHKLIYDNKKLRYGKIYLAADADPDGAAIRNLLIEMFWWLCPELIMNGHIYTTIPPLFRITTKKNEYIYLKDGKALEEYKTAHPNERYIVSRNKGLGESDPEELYDALLNPATRNVKMLQVVDTTETAKLIECLLGQSVPPRREFLLKHSEEANDVD